MSNSTREQAVDDKKITTATTVNDNLESLLDQSEAKQRRAKEKF